ncbi:MAG: hypothetical protein N839_0011230 [Desulfofustis sp. PB-SRB1]|jgi:hypothetical protein|nr:hypothetical protein [Desulfofustis sp. PB-SRB1]MBM1002975.1 hypothetical protein [Desulfofustis sp. PB-SRB1]HBH29832.1 hypothetical protein [Desulfofustis sp.]
MSEYQYYEFLAIDRSLTEEEMDELRALSTRAAITPVSFTNEYNWGNFKGDPYKLMQRHFDAHVYVANWMTAIFMVRLPIEALTREVAKAAAVPYLLDIKSTSTHWIITLSLEESENYDRFGMEDGRGWMARLAPVRDELLRGDLRSLYIGWLPAVAEELMDDDELEPLSVVELANLTAAQQALAEFLEVDPDLLAGAGMGSPAAQEREVSQREMDKWIDALPREETHLIMKQLLEGNGRQAELSIRNRFASWRRGLQTGDADAPRRTVGALRQNAQRARYIRLEKQKRDRDQLETKRCEKRKEYLKNLSSDFPKAWASVRELVERGTGRGYDEACRILVDIADAYALYVTKKDFQQELEKFMAGHPRRKALIQRLVKAGIWKDG